MIDERFRMDEELIPDEDRRATELARCTKNFVVRDW